MAQRKHLPEWWDSRTHNKNCYAFNSELFDESWEVLTEIVHITGVIENCYREPGLQQLFGRSKKIEQQIKKFATEGKKITASIQKLNTKGRECERICSLVQAVSKVYDTVSRNKLSKRECLELLAKKNKWEGGSQIFPYPIDELSERLSNGLALSATDITLKGSAQSAIDQVAEILNKSPNTIRSFLRKRDNGLSFFPIGGELAFKKKIIRSLNKIEDNVLESEKNKKVVEELLKDVAK